MKYFLLALLFVLSFSLSTGQDADEKFVPLFNGKSLNGWTSSTDRPESFSVQDGFIKVKGGKAHLFYTGKIGDANFKNFELKLKARTTKGSNSGVYFHTQYQEEGWPNVGFEAQVNSTHTDPRKTGSLYGIVNMWVPREGEHPFVARVSSSNEVFISRPRAPSIDGEWFDYHIIVDGENITIKVNGEISVQWKQPEGWSKKRRIGSGTIALQAHDPNSETHYKDIRLLIKD